MSIDLLRGAQLAAQAERQAYAAWQKQFRRDKNRHMLSDAQIDSYNAYQLALARNTEAQRAYADSMQIPY